MKNYRPQVRRATSRPFRVTSKGYRRVLMDESDPFYAMCHCDGFVFEHRLVLARKLGRVLLPHEVVHHVNRDKLDNRPENLMLLEKGTHDIISLQSKMIDELLLKVRQYEPNYMLVTNC